MPSNIKEAALWCGCCGSCLTGCCIPVDHSNPLYEPNGTPKNVPFCIDAPGCVDFDGFCGTMLCGGAMPAVTGSCGICNSCLGGAGTLVAGILYFRMPPPVGCIPDTCALKVCFRISCLQSATLEPGLEECCQRFKLHIGCDYPIIGWDEYNCVQGCCYWKSVSPTTCVCNPDPDGFPAVVFPLDVAILCEEPDCDGFMSCCNFATCNLSGATLII